MKKYQKPEVEYISLKIEENITAADLSLEDSEFEDE